MTENEIYELIDLYIDEEATEKQKQQAQHLIKTNHTAKNAYHNKIARRQLMKDSTRYIKVDSDDITSGIDKHIDESIYRNIKLNRREKTLKVWSYISTIAALIMLAIIVLSNTDSSVDFIETIKLDDTETYLFEYPIPNFDYQTVTNSEPKVETDDSPPTLKYINNNAFYNEVFSRNRNRQQFIYETDITYSTKLLNRKTTIGKSIFGPFLSTQSRIYMQ